MVGFFTSFFSTFFGGGNAFGPLAVLVTGGAA